MAIAYDGHRGNTTEKPTSADTTLAVTIANSNIPAGSLVIVRAVTDNFVTTSGESTEHSIGDSVGGNTWTRIKEHTISPTNAAEDGTTASLWYSILSNGLTSGSSTITLTCANAVKAKTIAVEEFTGTNLTFESGNSVAQTTDPRDVSISSLTSREHLLIAFSGVEGTSLFSSEDGDYTSFATNVVQTSGGSAASNITQFGGYRIATLTTDTRTVDLTAARDGVDIIGSFYESAGGTTYPQAVAGTLTTSGTVAKEGRKALGGTLTTAGALIMRAQKALSGTLTTSGTAAKEGRKLLGGSITPDGAVSKQTGKPLGGTLTTAGVVAAIKTALISLGGTLTTSGSLAKQVNKPLGGALTTAGEVIKETRKALGGTLTTAGVVAAIKTALISLGGTLTTSGSLSRQTGKALGGTLTTAGEVIKETRKALGGTLTSAGGLVKQTLKFLAGLLTPSGSVTGELQQMQTTTFVFQIHLAPRSGEIGLAARSNEIGMLFRSGEIGLVARSRRITMGARTGEIGLAER